MLFKAISQEVLASLSIYKVKAEILALQEEDFVVFQRKVMLGITIVSIVDYQTEYGYDYFP